jgi:uncharacterized phiE125 gp8 family phage protein
MIHNTKLVEVTGVEPVLLAEAKSHLRIVTADEDSYINSLITLSREYCENFTKRSLISSTFLMSLLAFPHSDKPAVLPYPPIKQVEWIKYKCTDGIQKTLIEDTDYLTISTIAPGVVVPIPNKSWPTDIYDVPDAVQIQYQTEPANIPVSIKQSMLLLIGHYFDNRELSTDRRMSEIPMSVHSLLWPYRILEF